MRFFVSLALALFVALAAQAQGSTTTDEDSGLTIRLRPIDEASVRIVGVGGTRLVAFDGRSGSSRIVGIPDARHGTGVVVGPGLIATARHVIESADFLAVIFPGETEPVAARVLYVDPFHDVAILRVERETTTSVPVPERAPVLSLSQRLSASGYPIEIRERYPAAVSGELSRQRNDGRLQLAMSVNPGNSGGPLFNARGEVIGVACAGFTSFNGLAFGIPAQDLRDFLVNHNAYLYDPSQPQNGVKYLDPPYQPESPPSETD